MKRSYTSALVAWLVSGLYPKWTMWMMGAIVATVCLQEEEEDAGAKSPLLLIDWSTERFTLNARRNARSRSVLKLASESAVSLITNQHRGSLALQHTRMPEKGREATCDLVLEIVRTAERCIA